MTSIEWNRFVQSYKQKEEEQRITRLIQNKAEEMYYDLLRNKLEVILIPAQEGNGMLRVAESRPPSWYSKFCSLYPLKYNYKKNRKLNRTIIKRRCTLRGLYRLMNKDKKSIYAERLLNFIERELDNEVPF
jgi:hypothetical protein